MCQTKSLAAESSEPHLVHGYGFRRGCGQGVVAQEEEYSGSLCVGKKEGGNLKKEDGMGMMMRERERGDRWMHSMAGWVTKNNIDDDDDDEHDSETNRMQRQTAYPHGCQPGRTTKGRQERRERGMRETSRPFMETTRTKRKTIHPSPNSQILLASKALSFTSMHAGQSINQSTTATKSLQTAIEQTARLIKLPLIDPRNHVRFEPSSRKTPPVETKGSRRKRKESKETE
ncbi:uncharacterized protein IWZ02DRAFT_263850 [Phyllosticta citriasiana]|uniref:uncharacterized protein n=1 Tax=Phyllosticta citriasiana TaxID=595635 RepID=UPI0030FD846F